jgi:hypothetical protein
MRLGGAVVLAGLTLAAPPATARADVHSMRIDAGIGLGLYMPPDVRGLGEALEFDRVTSTSLDLALLARPHDRIELALEAGYGRSWNGGYSQSAPAGVGQPPLVCEHDIDARDYLRVNGALLVHLSGGATRPFLVAGGGIWTFLEKEAHRVTRCSNGTESEGEFTTLSSSEEPLLIVGGGIRLREGHRIGYRLDYRANIVFEDRDESLIHQLRAGLVFAPSL